MAVTKIWDVKGKIETVLKYTANDKKTWNNQFGHAAAFHRIDKNLSTVLEYTADEMKTEKQMFVTGINCSSDPILAAKQFNATKQTYNKEGGIICFHGYQSFEAGEVTAAEAHEIGVELAKKLWGNRFEVLISTHCNTNHFHNHFVINSVSYADGLRYYDTTHSYWTFRNTSDEICKAHHLSIVDTYKHKAKKISGLKDAEEKGFYSERQMIKDAIDICVASTPQTFEDFIGLMKNKGFVLERRGSFLRAKFKNGNKFWRLDRLGDTYSESDIRYRIREQWRITKDYNYSTYKPKGIMPGSLEKLYFYYCYLLGIFSKKRPEREDVYQQLCEDKCKAEKLNHECRLLADHHIQTFEQLEQYYDSLNEKYKDMSEQRKYLRNKLRRSMNDEENQTVKNQIKQISSEMSKIRKEKNYCIDIANNSAGIEGAVRLIEFPMEQRKENQKDEREVKEYEHQWRSR